LTAYTYYARGFICHARDSASWADGGLVIEGTVDVGGGSSRNGAPERSTIARLIRTMSVPIVLGWLALTVITNMAVPPLETVGEAHTVSMNAKDAPSAVSMEKIGKTFQEFTSDSAAMVILEGEQPLGADAHHY
jgi:RND superfamily putative drug exporter